jgi:WD40 repeat protein/tRNA A-37 threonylcarbamoyl transferase component Bud32
MGASIVKPSTAQHDAERNLLFSLLALNNNFIEPSAIVAAFHAWTRDKSRPMGQIFVDQGAIDHARRDLLEVLVELHIEDHDSDVERSLAAVGLASAMRGGLEAIADPDLGASLAHVRLAPGPDPDATRPYSPGPETPGQELQAPGQRFKILRFHARGGLGEVYVARDEELHREVALKRIQDEHADDPDSRSRFVVEAEITGGLEHPGIVPVYGLGHYADGRPYYAMRFIKGESLREAIRQFHGAEGPARDPGARSLELHHLLRRFLDVCNAVAYAHSRGVLHRDLKPSNVMLGPYGETLVVDWGLAKVVGRSDAVGSELTLRPSSGSDVQATRAGVAIGTLSYMSPEQARGDLEKLGPASDVYSLGATLYHVLTGRAAFGGADAAEVQAKVIVGDFPKPREAQSNIPAALEAICLKAMAREPQDRYATPRGLADDVEHWLADEPVSAWREPLAVRLGRWGRRHRSAVGVTAALVVIAALGLSTLWLKVAKDKEEAQHYINRFILAEREWQAVNVRRAEQLLDECPPARRGWEWRYLKRLCHQDLRTLDYDDVVFGVAYSPDGGLIAAACMDKTVKLWDATTFQVKRTLKHSAHPSIVAFSPDGRRLASIAASGNQLGAVTLWDVATGEAIRTLPAKNGTNAYLAFSPDGQRVASTSGERSDAHEVVVWDVESGRKLVTFTGHDDAINAVAFSPDGRRIVSVSGSQEWTPVEKKLGAAYVWDAATGAVLSTFRGHADAITGVAFRPDGRQVATSSMDRTIKIWDAATADEIRTLRGHTNFVNGIAFRGDGRQLASGGDDGAVKLWDPDRGVELRTFRGHTAAIVTVAYSPDGTRLVSGAYDHTVKVWDTAEIGMPRALGEFTWAVTNVVYSPRGDRLAAAGGVDRTILVWDTAAERQILRLDALPGTVWGLAFSPDGRRLAAAMGDWRVTDRAGIVKVWSVADGREQLNLRAHVGIAWSVAFSPDGQLLASGGGEAGTPDVATLWDAATGRPIRALRGHGGGITKVAFSPDGSRLASASGDTTVKIWDVVSGRELVTLRGYTAQLRSLAYSPDGKLLAAAGEEKNVWLWDATTGRSRATLYGHTHFIRGLAFQRDRDGGLLRLASASLDGTVKIWDAVSGQEIVTLRSNSGALDTVVFSPDGQQLAAGGFDKTVKIWDAAPTPRSSQP